jgi:predicted PurR-regulated permease PerM
MVEADAPLLTSAQRRLVAFALTCVAFAAVVVTFWLAGAGLARFVSEFSGVICPLAVAGILAMMLRPLVSLLQRRLKLGRLTAVILLYGLFLLIVTGLLLGFVPAVIAQVLDLINYLPDLWRSSEQWTRQHFPEWRAIVERYLQYPAVKNGLSGLASQAQELASHVIPSLRQAGAGIFSLLGIIGSLAVIPVYLFFFLQSDADPTRNLHEHLPFLNAKHREDVVFLVREFIGIVVAFFRGQLLIGMIMGVLYAIGFTLAGLKFGMAIGLLMGVLNIVPYLGSILGLSVAIPLALLQPEGSGTLAGICLGIFVIVQMTEGWLLTPRIMGRQTGLHPVVIIIAIFFWSKALSGIVGLMLAVPLTAFFVTAWRLLRRKYLGHAKA